MAISASDMAWRIGEIFARIVEVGGLQHGMDAEFIKFRFKILATNIPIMTFEAGLFLPGLRK